MEYLILLCNIVFFAVIGVVGFVQPNRIITSFGATPHADMRNEIRTVYGGMCIALAFAGIAALLDAKYLKWVAATYALILLSNAAGRLIGRLIEASSPKIIWFLTAELILGSGALYTALRVS